MVEAMKSSRRGVVLIWALVMMAVTTTILGAIGSHYAGAMNIGRQYLEKNDEYYAFLSANGRFSKGLSDALASAIAGSGGSGPAVSMGSGANGSDSVKKLVDALKGLVGKKFEEGGYNVEFNIEGLDTLEGQLQGGKGSVKVTATVYRGSGIGGIQLMTFEEELQFTSKSTGSLTTEPIFDYVYFANNKGHLESPNSARIIANGDVGANDSFKINGATINGYVWAHANSQSAVNNAVTLYGTPHIWPYAIYLKRVVSEYRYNNQEYYTLVRPTDPIPSNGEMVEWSGGYQAPGALSEYVTVSSSGDLEFYDYSKIEIEPVLDPDLEDANPGTLTGTPMPMPTDSAYYKSNVNSFKENNYKNAVKEWIKTRYSTYKNLPNFPSWSNYKSLQGKTTDQKYAKYEEAIEKWASDRNINITGVSAAALAEYNRKYTIHTNYVAEVKKFEDEHDGWEGRKKEWLEKQQGAAGDDGIVLTKDTYHQDLVTGEKKYIITASTNLVSMPNVSDDDAYRDYCKNYICTNGNKGGSISCANRYKTDTGDVNISCSFVFNDKLKKVYSYKSGWGGRTSFERGHVFETVLDSGVTTTTRTLANVDFSGGYKASIYPYASRPNNQRPNSSDCSDSLYLGGSATAEEIKKAECGSVILVGTANYPITITGPVYFDGDVIIRGFVSGQGTIYSGRNIHIIGDIAYLNPPSWPHSTDSMNRYTPTEVGASNMQKDMLMLVARGNIIVGDYTTTEWMNNCRSWMTIGSTDSNYQSGNSYCNDYNDNEIGYAGFNRDYTANENPSALDENARIVFAEEENAYKTSLYDNLSFIEKGLKVQWYNNQYPCDYYYYHVKPRVEKNNRKFYQCKLGDDVITGLMQTSSASNAQQPWRWSVIDFLRWLFGRGRRPVADQNHNASSDYISSAKDVSSGDDAGDVTQIDAILFANHGIFGRVGGVRSHKFKLHGAMICRDEGLLPSFNDRFKNVTGAEAWINWDMRIKSDSAEGIQGTGAPARASGETTITMRETTWRQR